MLPTLPFLVALSTSAILAILERRRWSYLGSGGVLLALAAAAGLFASAAPLPVVLVVALGGTAVALLPNRIRPFGMVLWLAGALWVVAGTLLARQELTSLLGMLVAVAGTGVAGAMSWERARAPGRGVVLAASAVVVALAMLLPGSSLRLGGQGLTVAAAMLPLLRRDEDDRLIWVAAGLLALGAWTSVLLASLDWTGLWLAPLVGVPWLGRALSARPRLAIAAQVAAVVLLGMGVLAGEIWSLWMGGVPL